MKLAQKLKMQNELFELYGKENANLIREIFTHMLAYNKDQILYVLEMAEQNKLNQEIINKIKEEL